MEVDDVPPPPPPPPGGRGPSERRAKVTLPPHEADDGPTYWRLGIDYPVGPQDHEVHIQCGRIKKLENLEAVGPNLKTLTLVASCIERVENLESNVNLEHLELYQNLVKKIENIGHLSKLTNLDLSFNKIRSCDSLGACQFEQLERLYLSSNKISDIEGVFHFRNVKLLEFGSNRIRCIPPDMGQLTKLEQLWLGKNKIVSMALPPLPALRHLSLQSNRLEAWDTSLFENAPGLTHAYFGHNNLPNLPDEFTKLTNLVELDLAKNAITLVRPMPQLTKLQDLWMNDNQVSDLAEARHLASFPALRTVYLERNPMHGLGNAESEARYKEAILQAAPDLVQLDAVRLNSEIKVVTDGEEKKVMGIRKR
uniref:Protein phosphatase 1 regulatory subunit 7 n=1 Tax=Zooxanthella nutricula TaxID=1333877 RepID=A0A6U6X0Z3_9DINO